MFLDDTATVMFWGEWFLLLVCILLAVAGGFVIIVVLSSKPFPVLLNFESEKTFFNPKTESQEPFPHIEDAPSVSLSVVVPAYNEEARLPVMLVECTDYLEQRRLRDKTFSYEIIVVDDGSTDETTKVGQKWSSKLGSERIRVLTLQRNRGKGGAVRLGALRARGRLVLFADADGATVFEDLEKLESAMAEIEGDYGMVCGSRAHLEQDSIAKRSLFRTILMHGFHWCVGAFGAQCVRDTQCGFKLLKRSSARVCFASLHIERWAFDVELLKIAEMTDMPVKEVAVRWEEVDGSKLNPVLASAQMFKDLFLLWLRYRIGAWRLKKRAD